jgi:pimeloyl-ACP methyl ester carboxylesterase
MHRITHRVIAVLIALGFTFGFGLTPTTSQAAPTPVPGLPACQTDSLPTNDPLHPSQIILLCAPPAQLWNGQLVVYAHGYVDPSLDISLPAELNLYLPNTTNPNPTSLPAVLLGQGFAVATTSYRKNGYVVEQGGQDIDALVKYAKQALPGSTNRVYLVGTSQGALISTMLLERSPKTYNGGALALCGAIGGWSYQTQYAGDFAIVFNYFFPGVAAQGPTAVALALQNNPPLAAQLFRVTGAAVDPLDPSSAVTTALSVLFFSSPPAQLDLQTTAGGNPYGNLRTRYRGSFDDRALNAGVARVAADRAAQRYVRRFYTPEGEIKRPVVTLHNLLDPVVPFAVEQLFAQRVNDEGKASLLTSIPARHAYGHCNFDPDEILWAFGVLASKSQ